MATKGLHMNDIKPVTPFIGNFMTDSIKSNRKNARRAPQSNSNIVSMINEHKWPIDGVLFDYNPTYK